MDGEQNANPYETPLQNGGQSAGNAPRTGWPLLIIGSIFLVVSFTILAAARSSLADLLIEFDVQLSGLSSLAYLIANNWFALIAVLLLFTIATHIAYSRMRSARRHSSWYFLAFVSFIWLLFTFGFAFGILQPLYLVTTGLTD
jgi:cellobiose-specific phosphotransferase system component IIC